MEGENFVSLKGTIQWPELKVVGDNEYKLFKGKLSIPIDGKHQQVKISAWGDMAEALNNISKNSFIHVHGHIEERSYDSTCKHCKGPDKKFWTEVVVDNFVTLR